MLKRTSKIICSVIDLKDYLMVFKGNTRYSLGEHNNAFLIDAKYLLSNPVLYEILLLGFDQPYTVLNV